MKTILLLLLGCELFLPSQAFADDQIVVFDFVVTLPDGYELNRNGLTPPGKLTFKREFKFPGKSTLVLPASTEIEQLGEGWKSLRVTLPSGKELKFSREEACGCKVSKEPFKTVEIKLPDVNPGARKLIERISSERPALDVFFNLLKDFEFESELDYNRTVSEYLASQKPLLSVSEIAKLHDAQRASIERLDYKSEVSNSSASPLSEFNRPESVRRQFALDGVKLFLEQETISATGITSFSCRSYDGSVEREFRILPDGNRRGSIISSRGPHVFFDADSLLWVSCLIDDELDLGDEESGDSLLDRGLQVLEKSVRFNDEEVIPLLSFDLQVFYVSPERGFCLVGNDSPVVFNKSKLRLEDNSNRSSKVLEGHLEFDNNVWLPRKSTTKWFRNGNLQLTHSIEYTDIRVNETIEPERFSEIFEAGTLVHDSSVS